MLEYLLADVTGCDLEIIGIAVTSAAIAADVLANCQEYCNRPDCPTYQRIKEVTDVAQD